MIRRHCCYPVLPTVFGEELSYQEQLCKMYRSIGHIEDEVETLDSMADELDEKIAEVKGEAPIKIEIEGVTLNTAQFPTELDISAEEKERIVAKVRVAFGGVAPFNCAVKCNTPETNSVVVVMLNAIKKIGSGDNEYFELSGQFIDSVYRHYPTIRVTPSNNSVKGYIKTGGNI